MERNRDWNEWRRLAPVGLGLLVFAVYLNTMYPSIGPEDAAELAASAATLGIPHNPGYPLWILSGKMFQVLFPWANPAYRANLLSAMSAAAAIGLLAFLCRAAGMAGIGLALLLAVAPSVSLAGQAAEVYGPALLAGLLLFWAASAAGIPAGRRWILAGYLAGVCFAAHQFLILWFPGVVWLLFRTTRHPRNYNSIIKIWRAARWAIPAFLLGASVYLVMPFRSFARPWLDVGEPRTPARFFHSVFRKTGQRLAGEEPYRPQWLLPIFGHQTGRNLLYMGPAALAAALAVLSRRRSPIAAAGWLLWLGSGPIFWLWGNPAPDPHGHRILLQFELFPMASLCLAASPWLARPVLPGKMAPTTARWIFSAVLFGWMIYFSSLQDRRRDFTVPDYARNLLRSAPERSVIFAPGDTGTSSLFYIALTSSHPRSFAPFPYVRRPWIGRLASAIAPWFGDGDIRKGLRAAAADGRLYSTNPDVPEPYRGDLEGLAYRPRSRGLLQHLQPVRGRSREPTVPEETLHSLYVRRPPDRLEPRLDFFLNLALGHYASAHLGDAQRHLAAGEPEKAAWHYRQAARIAPEIFPAMTQIRRRIQKALAPYDVRMADRRRDSP